MSEHPPERDPSGAPGQPRPRRPWGPIATTLFGVLAASVFFLAQIAVAVPYVIYRVTAGSGRSLETVAADLERDGLLFALAEVVAAPVAVAFILFVVWVRRGPPVRDYLALRPIPRPATLRWLAITGLAVVLFDAISVASGFPVVPGWVKDTYRSAGSVPLLIVAMVVVAPAFEELLFRGFLFEGLRHSFLGVSGTVVLTSAVWASVHIQYEWFYIGHIFALGLLLGVARARTASLVLPLQMHALLNAVASLQMVIESR